MTPLGACCACVLMTWQLRRLNLHLKTMMQRWWVADACDRGYFNVVPAPQPSPSCLRPTPPLSRYRHICPPPPPRFPGRKPTTQNVKSQHAFTPSDASFTQLVLSRTATCPFVNSSSLPNLTLVRMLRHLCAPFPPPGQGVRCAARNARVLACSQIHIS